MRNYVKLLKSNSIKVVMVAVLSVTFFVAGVALYAQVWTPPTQSPPGGNPAGFILADPSATQEADLNISGKASVGSLDVNSGLGRFFNDILFLNSGRLCFGTTNDDDCIANKNDVGQTLFTVALPNIYTDITQAGIGEGAGKANKYISLTAGQPGYAGVTKLQLMDESADAGDIGGDWVQLTTQRSADTSQLTWGDNIEDILHISSYYIGTDNTVPVATFKSYEAGGQVGVGDANPDTKLTVYSTGYGDVLKVYNGSNLPIVAGFDSSNGNGYIASKNGAPLRLESNSSSFEVSPNKDAYGHIYADYTSSDNTAGGIRLWGQNGKHLGSLFGIDQNTPPAGGLDVFGLLNSVGKWIMVNASNGTTGSDSAYTFFYLGTTQGSTRALELTRDGLNLSNTLAGGVESHRDKVLETTSGDLILRSSDESQAAASQHGDVIVDLDRTTNGTSPTAPRESFVVRTTQVLGDGSYDFFKITNYLPEGGESIGPRLEIGGSFRDPCAGGVCDNPIANGTMDPLVALRNNDASLSQYDTGLYIENQGSGWGAWINTNTPENPFYRHGLRVDADPSVNTPGSFDKSVALFVNGVFKLNDGTQAAGKILTAVTADGYAKWEYPADIGLGADLWTETGRGVSYVGDYSIGQIRLGIGGSKTSTSGTWTPIGSTIGAALDVIGPQWGTSEPVARFRNNDSGSWANGGDQLLIHEKWGSGLSSQRAILNAKNYNNDSIFRVQPNGVVCINDDCRSTWNGDGTGLVTKIIAGTGISVNPSSGVGDVTVSALSQSPWLDGTDPGEIYYNGGNVGIGTNNPQSKLQVEGSVNNAVFGRTTGNGAGVVGIANGGAGSVSVGVQGIQSANGTSAAGLFEGDVYADRFCIRTGAGISGDCKDSWSLSSPWNLSVDGNFITNLINGGGSATHKNVGIGVESPTASLEVNSLAAANALTLRNFTNSAAGPYYIGMKFKFSTDIGNEANKYATIRAFAESAYANTVGLSFLTNSDYTTPPTETMTLSPWGDLDVSNSVNAPEVVTQSLVAQTLVATGNTWLNNDAIIGGAAIVEGRASLKGDLYLTGNLRFSDGTVRPEFIYAFFEDCGGAANPTSCGYREGDSRITTFYQENAWPYADYLVMECPVGFKVISGGGSCDDIGMWESRPYQGSIRRWRLSCGHEVADVFNASIVCARFN